MPTTSIVAKASVSHPHHFRDSYKYLSFFYVGVSDHFDLETLVSPLIIFYLVALPGTLTNIFLWKIVGKYHIGATHTTIDLVRQSSTLVRLELLDQFIVT